MFLLCTFSLPKYEKLWRKLQFFAQTLFIWFSHGYVMHFIFESIHCQYLCNFSVKNKSRAFFGKKCRLKKKSKKKAKGPIVRHKPLEWGLCVTKGCSRNDSGWKNWKRREWADTGFLYLSWSPSVHQSCSVRPPVRFPSAVAVWFWLSPTNQLTNQISDQPTDQPTDRPNKWPSADLAEESSDSSVSIYS